MVKFREVTSRRKRKTNFRTLLEKKEKESKRGREREKEEEEEREERKSKRCGGMKS